MTELVDRSVGRLLQFLDTSGLDRSTLIVFTTDHGALGRSAQRKPLRGAKADLYEGGVRVPLVYRWTGHLVPGERAGPVFGTDLFPTLLEFCSVPVPGALDGISLKPVLEQAVAAPADRGELCWHFPHYHHLGLAPCGAIRSGRWKLIEWFERTIGGANDGPAYELFDLEADVGETTNLADREPARRDELVRRLREWRGMVGAQEMMPNPRYNPDRLASAAPPPPGDAANPFGE
jgi:uncharacterized sulfatase